jgi:uncharacterized delta-60 repeat protein
MRRLKWRGRFLLAAALMAAGTVVIGARAGGANASTTPVLDATFGVGGYGDPADYSSALIGTQPDGGVVTLSSAIGGTIPGSLKRLLPNGAIDTSFGTNGKAILNPDATQIGMYGGLETTADGSIVVSATWQSSSGAFSTRIHRMLANGQPDPTFGSGGTAIVDEIDQRVVDMALAPGGKIVLLTRKPASTTCCTVTTLVRRFQLDGSPDTTFGAAGTVRVGEVGTGLPGIAIGPTDAVTVGTSNGLFRFASDGTPDASFGNGGVIAGWRDAAPTALPDGKTLLVTNGEVGAAANEVMVRQLLPSGALDVSFGNGGVRVVSVPAASAGASRALLTNGKATLVIGANDLLDGTTTVPRSFVFERLNSDGSSDAGGSGFLPFDATASTAWRPAADNSGRVVLGITYHPSGLPNRASVVRVRAPAPPPDTPILDNSFGTTGYVNDLGDRTSGVAVQPDGSVITFADLLAGSITIARLTPTGVPDHAFGGSGVVTIDKGSANYGNFAGAATRPDGRFVVAVRWSGSGSPTYLYGFSTDGAPDASFGDNGVVRLEDPVVTYTLSIALQADGKVLVFALGQGATSTTYTTRIFRRLVGGAPDLSFGTAGQVTLADTDPPASMVLAPDGSIFASTYGGIVKYVGTGALDTTFGVNGETRALRGAALLPLTDGNLLAVTDRSTGAAQNELVVHRLTPSGSVDASYGTAGKTSLLFPTAFTSGVWPVLANGRPTIVALGV